MSVLQAVLAIVGLWLGVNVLFVGWLYALNWWECRRGTTRGRSYV